ncbi:MAG TPA: FtsX-like permease family protein [Bacteroidales bacterium]|nr:FtsX-like permease family protein [Bacteroidales bacterium]
MLSDFLVAFRNIIRNKVESAISILGLSIGLGCLIILLALIVHERSFDRYIPGYRNVYRILLGEDNLTSYPLAERLSEELPMIKDYFRYYGASEIHVRTPGNIISKESGFSFADNSIFRVLGIKMLAGTPASLPGEVAISKTSAIKYFGNASPLGKTLQVKLGDGFTHLSISGIYKDFPSNSTLCPSFIADIKMSEIMLRQFQQVLGDFGDGNKSYLGWDRRDFVSYVVLADDTDPLQVSSALGKYNEFLPNDNKAELIYNLQPVTDIYLGSAGTSLRKVNRQHLAYYEGISFMILIISLVNFILLTRAGVSKRIHDFGTRKVYGASRGKIVRLIIIESFIIVLISVLPATFIVDHGINLVNNTLNKTITTGTFLDPILLLLIIFVILSVSVIAGWLIGIYYSGVPALDLISGKTRIKGRTGKWNYALLAVHFTILMVFISGIITVSKQIQYSKSGYKGIDPRNILVADLTSSDLMHNFNTIKNEIEKIPGVKAVAGGTFIPPFGNYLPVTLKNDEGEKIRFDGLIMGEGMTDLLGIEVIDGEPFGPYQEGSLGVIINESSAKKYNVKAGESLLAFQVRGIVKDFNVHSFHLQIQPMVILQQNPEEMGIIAIKTDGTNDDEVKAKLKELFSRIAPDEFFETTYLIDRIEGFYEGETKQSKIIGAFAILTAFLSVMGLFGVSMISIGRRRKEIGLRKVNGATIREILLIVNSDLFRWFFVAFVVSVPVSVFLLNKWLEKFAYRTELSWWIFAASGLLAIIIVILTVTWQSLRAAWSNPVESIRYE